MENTVLQQLMEMLSFSKLLAAGALLAGTWLMLTILQRALIRLAEHFPRHRLSINRIYPVLRIVVWAVITSFVLLRILSPPESIVFALLGSVGLAVGLAAQDAMRNMVAGLIIMFNPPYRVGDMVNLAGHYGEVVKLEWSVTWLKTFDDNTVMIPNAEVLKGAVSNSNSGALNEMIAVSMDIPASSDHALAVSLAKECAACSPYTYLKNPIVVNVSSRYEYGQFLVQITIKAYVLDVRLERRFASDVTHRLLDAYKAHHIYPVTTPSK